VLFLSLFVSLFMFCSAVRCCFVSYLRWGSTMCATFQNQSLRQFWTQNGCRVLQLRIARVVRTAVDLFLFACHAVCYLLLFVITVFVGWRFVSFVGLFLFFFFFFSN